jgi:hypothetical protein
MLWPLELALYGLLAVFAIIALQVRDLVAGVAALRALAGAR